MNTHLKTEAELPPLQWYDSLSPDAQRVMLSLQRKYAKMREQIIMNQMKKELFSQDPGEYYRSLYSRQFKAEPTSRTGPRSGQSKRDDDRSMCMNTSLFSRRPVDNLKRNTQTHPSTNDSVQIKQEPPDSPFVVAQAYNANVGNTRKFYLDSRAHCSNEIQTLVNSSFSVNKMHAPALPGRTQTRKRPVETFCEDVQSKHRRASSSNTASIGARQCHSETGSQLVLESIAPKVSQHFVKSQTLPETSFALGFSMEECDIVPVPPVHFPLEPYVSSEGFDEELYQASQDLFASIQELKNTGHDQNYVPVVNSTFHSHLIPTQLQQSLCHQTLNQGEEIEFESDHQPRPELHENQIPKEKISSDQSKNCQVPKYWEHSRQSHVQVEKSDVQETLLPLEVIYHQNDSILKENSPHVWNCTVSVEEQRIPVQQTAQHQSRLDSFLQIPPCSVARKLEVNRKIRLTEDSTEQTNTVSRKTDNTENERKNIPKSGKLTKTTRGKKTEISNIENCDQRETDRTSLDGSLVDVFDLTDMERERIKNSILQSKTVCLTLVFSNETTLVRNFQPTGLQLKYVAIKVVSETSHLKATSKDSSTLLFPFASIDDSFTKWLRSLFRDVMDSIHIEKIAMNAKQLCTTLSKMLVESGDKDHMAWTILDPVVGSWLLNSDKSPKCLQDVIKASGVKGTINVIQGGLRSLNSDLNLLHEMMTVMKQRLRSQHLWELFYKIETPLIPVLACLEMQKLLVNTTTFMSFSNVLKKKLKKLEEKAFASAGHSFCINSHPQLRQILYEELRLDEKLPAKSKIAKTSVAHQKSTSEVTLTQLKDTHSLPAIVLEYRQLQKLKSTYVDGMMTCVKNGYLSTHWDQTAAATGRLTSCQPNIQTIPKVPVTITEYEDNFIIGKPNDERTDIYAREPFISHEGHLLLAADFQQIELRLLAHLANDPVLLGIFNNQEVHDIFIELTSQWLGKPVSNISPSEREQTKRIVYSVMYGVGKEKLAEYLKVSPDNAKCIMTSFLMKFPAVNTFTKKCVDFCQQHGFTQTIFKRKRLIPHIHHSSHQLRAQAGRQAVNFCVQGSAADLCKAAMLHVQDHLSKLSLTAKARLLAQIHDELLWEVDENYLESIKDVVKHVMEDSASLCGDMARLKVPIRVTLSVGKSWAHLHLCE